MPRSVPSNPRELWCSRRCRRSSSRCGRGPPRAAARRCRWCGGVGSDRPRLALMRGRCCVIASSRVGCGLLGAAQRDRAQIADAPHLVFGILNRQHVVVAVLGIDPVARRDHLVRSERGDHVADHFALIESELAGARAVHIEPQRRIVDVLRNENIGDTVDRRICGGQVGSR